jgi:hypothetical protein
VRNVYKILVGKPEAKRPLEELGLDTRILLKWLFLDCGGG